MQTCLCKSLAVLLLVTGCTASATAPTAPPTDPILVDSYFSAQALLDVNGNGQLDPGDTPVENATFYVEVDGVKAFGDRTDAEGRAFVIIPSAVEYPVTVSMEAPVDSDLRLISPAPVALQTGDPMPIFLFSSK